MSRTDKPRAKGSTARSSKASVRPLRSWRISDRKSSLPSAICGAENGIMPSAVFNRPSRTPLR
jgi:hypothetical protein